MVGKKKEIKRKEMKKKWVAGRHKDTIEKKEEHEDIVSSDNSM